jgi:hypothetical protein
MSIAEGKTGRWGEREIGRDSFYAPNVDKLILDDMNFDIYIQ